MIIILASILVINGCIQETPKEEKEEDIENCDALWLFDLTEEEVEIQYSECDTCSPWYTPQLAKFNAKISDKSGKEYNLAYSNNCPRHEGGIVNYCISTEEKNEVYNKAKKKICSGINYFKPHEGKKICNPDFKYGLGDDVDSFIQCLEEIYFMEEINIDEGKESCSTTCNSDDNDCMIFCFEEYLEEKRTDLIDEWCDNYEEINEDKIIFSVQIYTNSNEWNKIKKGETC